MITNMKRIILISLIIFLSQLNTFAEGVNANQDKISLTSNTPKIEDEFVNSESFPKVLPQYVKQNDPIVDELAVPYKHSGEVLKLWVRKDSVRNNNINDELIDSEFISKSGSSILRRKNKLSIEDNFANRHAHLKKARKIAIKTNYDFTKKQIPVQLKIIKNLTTKNKILEGDDILFKTVQEISINGEVLPKGTEVIGRVETISASDKMGTPANIIVDNFYVKDRPDICFYGNVTKTGANRSIWVYPLYQAGNIMLYVAGFVFVPIHGGHAKLLTSDTYTVFYETNSIQNPQ